MNTKTYLLLLALFSTILTFAQNNTSVPEPIQVEDIVKTISRGNQPGLKVLLYQTEKKDAESQWDALLRKKAKAKTENAQNEIIARGITLKEVSNRPLNIYAVFNPYADYVEMYVFFETDSVFLTKTVNETEYLSARKFVRDFAVQTYREAVSDQIKTEEKNLSSLEKELKKLQKENDCLHEQINKEKRNVDNNNEKISMLKLDQQRVRQLIQTQKTELDQLRDASTSEEVIKAEEKKLKALEKELTRLEKDEDQLRRNNAKNETVIRHYERDLADNASATERKRQEINAQKMLLTNLRNMLKAIQ
ncbi:MAG: hypothetical protein KatS3mg031_1566 [Chitinophagales bacterium]|nr:MAG: hypothetical protein KatS3mg031_1566 [Chitinophagales bacterium]